MVESCYSIFQFDSNLCELTNNQTLEIELLIAFIIASFAGIIAVFFYVREQSSQEYGALQQNVRDLEHSIELKELEIMNKKQSELINEQKSIINKIKPVIDEQNRVIQKQEKIRVSTSIKNSLNYLDKLSE